MYTTYTHMSHAYIHTHVYTHIYTLIYMFVPCKYGLTFDNLYQVRILRFPPQSMRRVRRGAVAAGPIGNTLGTR